MQVQLKDILCLFTDSPSHKKLYPNDQILKVNDKDVQNAQQEDVINLIKYVTSYISQEFVLSNNISLH